MITPVPGMCFVIESVDELLAKDSKLKEIGFQQSEAHQRNIGVQGTIYAVNESNKCPACGGKRSVVGFKPGDKVLYSKFIAEQISIKDEQGKEIKNLRSVPVDGILAIIHV